MASSYIQIMEAYVNAFNHEDEMLVKLWSNTETKANYTSSISGIFIAGLFLYLNNADIREGLNDVLKVVVWLSSFAFTVSAILCICSMHIRKIYFPSNLQSKEEAKEIMENLNRLGESDQADFLKAYHEQQLFNWSSYLSSLRSALNKKAEFVALAQKFTALAIGLIIAVVWYQIS